jgi:hypothetical protein
MAAFALAHSSPSRVQNALDEAVRRMGLPSEAMDVFPGTVDDMARTYQVVQAMDIIAALGPWLKEVQPRFGPAIAPRFASIYEPRTWQLRTSCARNFAYGWPNSLWRIPMQSSSSRRPPV